MRLFVLECADKDKYAGVDVGQMASNNLQLGESDARAGLHIPSGQFPAKVLDAHYV